MEKPNQIIWKDIVEINGAFYAESAPVPLYGAAKEKDEKYLGDSEAEILANLGDAAYQPGIYDVDYFLDATAAKYGCRKDDIKLLSFREAGPSHEDIMKLPFGEESIGGYINGVSF